MKYTDTPSHRSLITYIREFSYGLYVFYELCTIDIN